MGDLQMGRCCENISEKCSCISTFTGKPFSRLGECVFIHSHMFAPYTCGQCKIRVSTFLSLHEFLWLAASPLGIVDISVDSLVGRSSRKRANWKLSSSFPPRKAERTTRKAPLTCLFIVDRRWVCNSSSLECRSSPLGWFSSPPLGWDRMQRHLPQNTIVCRVQSG